MAVLAFGFLLISPTASAAASGAEAGAAIRFQVEIHQAGLLALNLTLVGGIQPGPDSTEGGLFIEKDVDPWDDDLDGRRPPPPPVTFEGDLYRMGEQDDDPPATTVVTIDAGFDGVRQLVLRNRDGLAVAVTRREGTGTPLRLTRALAEGLYFLEVESLNGGDAVYALTLHRSSRP